MAKGKPESDWKEKILAWQASQQSPTAWCLENKIPITTFYGWKSRFKRLNSTKIPTKIPASKVKPGFVELKDAKPSGMGISLEYHGALIHLEQGFDPIVLRRCLDCLRGALC